MHEDELLQKKISNEWSKKGYLQSTIDPNDDKGLKCDYIDYWSRYYIDRFVLENQKGLSILEIGCGAGRNLFAFAPHIQQGYGIDIAEEQIKNAQVRQQQLGINNVSFFTDPENFFKLDIIVQKVFTMWVLAGYSNDEHLCEMLLKYRQKLTVAKQFVFFEQTARKTYSVQDKGVFRKKLRTQEEFENLLSKTGLRVKRFKILNEKGFGPFYRMIYGSKLYEYWPVWLRINKFLFTLDRYLVHRKIADTFTDCVFVCEPV